MNEKSIGLRRHEIDKARQIKMSELMKEYDETVYRPARKQLMRECAEQGHHGGKYHDNGFGWSWFYCGACGGKYDITGPNGEKHPDDGVEE